jgi:hypothetical protein
VTEAVGLLEPSGALGADDMAGLRRWFGDLATWMTTSPNGKAERAATNNHAIYYDLQLTEFSLFAGDVGQAKAVVSKFGQDRLTTQMAPDGGMPRELARTRSFHYATWALQAAFDIAALGECVDVDVWGYHDTEGRSLRKATDFIAAYSGREGDWKWREIDMNRQDLYDALLRAAAGFRDSGLGAKASVHAADFATARINLLYPPDSALQARPGRAGP